MTLAIVLWCMRSVLLGFWLVEHVSQVLRARRRGAVGTVSWTLPITINWQHGDRFGPMLWGGIAVCYLLATLASEAVR